MFGLRKRSLPEDFFQGACDVHCHLLPGVDDGFPTMEKSLRALSRLEKCGVGKMVLTPHFMKEYPDNCRENILREFEAFKAEASRLCPIELRLAAEYMLDTGFMKHFEQGLLTLDKDGNHVLCETSYLMYEHGTAEMLYEIMCSDYQPVIAHPERYEYANRANYFRWKDKNYKFQLNLLSLTGAYGELAMAKSHYLLKEGLYDFVGSDMHGLHSFERFLPAIRLSSARVAQLFQLIENNKKLVG